MRLFIVCSFNWFMLYVMFEHLHKIPEHIPNPIQSTIQIDYTPAFITPSGPMCSIYSILTINKFVTRSHVDIRPLHLHAVVWFLTSTATFRGSFRRRLLH